MKYALQIFETADHLPIRTITINGEPWFVFSDACRALEYVPKNGTFSRQADRLDDDQRRLVARSVIEGGPSHVQGEGLDAPNGASLLCTNESGLYTLIIRSDKPNAKEFRKWLTSEVLPSIRRTGNYSTAAPASLGEWQPFHDRISLTLSKVPEGYFCIFKEMADLAAQLITQGAKVNDETVPDISLGLAWGKEWTAKTYEVEFGPRVTYEHNYPAYFRQSRSNPQWPWCYPEEALGPFRRWLRNTYLPTAYPKYLASKEKKGDIPAIVVQAALKAVAAARPKALR
ncbi:hypothetical protein MKK68_24925 [Methylobacterium sp. E-016]|uniref:BRO-N domain-containing protein n=1 Tax=Methylobacterium sp. E-016 TaxID=2836556 RepID=UPI001FBAF9FE|nr:BRO family protein [Methylobacterium sp. E-016]MCJ2078842.1 hypothetical protein [Methylobacterium sp. E-016]